MNMETTRVEKHDGEFFVTDIQDLYIGVSVERVEYITGKVPDVDETEVAILLATITEARVILEWRNDIYEEEDEERNEKVANKAIIKLLQEYDIETLNGIFEDMKYHEIKQVLESGNPVAALREVA